MKKLALGKKARKHKGQVALVDDEDFEKLSTYNWYASYNVKMAKYYAQRHVSIGGLDQKVVRMHRLLTDAKFTEKVVHLNGDTLDNRRENLKVVRTKKEERDDDIKEGDRLDV